MKRVLVTGNLGYVGNVLVDMLLKENYEVVGCDTGYFPQGFTSNSSRVSTLKKDIREVTKNDLEEYFAVLHLAGLSNDPLGEINPSLTNDINYLATLRLARIAKEAEIERFVFSSSCSTYGINNDVVNEKSELCPITAYAKSKVDSEKEIIKLKSETFAPVILRNATVYGASPSQRLDLVVNNLTCSAYTTGSVRLLSDGTSWRPLVHVRDMCSAFIMAITASKDKVNGETFNVGSDEQNYTVRQIAEMIEDIIPSSKIEYAKDANKDARSYKVSFEKIKNLLGYKTKVDLKDGIREIYDVIKQKKFSESDFKNKSYYRVTYLKWLMENDFIDKNLKIIKQIPN